MAIFIIFLIIYNNNNNNNNKYVHSKADTNLSLFEVAPVSWKSLSRFSPNC